MALKSIQPLPLKLPSTNLHFLPFYEVSTVYTKNKCLDTETKLIKTSSLSANLQIYLGNVGAPAEIKRSERTLTFSFENQKEFSLDQKSSHMILC